MIMHLTPIEIVAELDRYIIGQSDAKRAVAVALRNRYRRAQLDPKMRDDITPKNIIMKGPTGVGKTEIARRLAKLVRAPFIKVEATKFTEVGYVGRDVESMIRDLAEMAVRLVKEEKLDEVYSKARDAAEKRIAEALIKARKSQSAETPEEIIKKTVFEDLADGKFDNQIIELDLDVANKPVELMPGMGPGINIADMMGGLMPKRKKKRKMTVKQAIEALTQEESEKYIDMESVSAEGIRRAEQDGIIFIDEIDKIASKGHSSGPDVSREGVQRDILPIVEGSTVMTKYGAIKTDYILFIASGAFHVADINDLIPELQGRFPIRVELKSLTKEDFVKILTVPENAVTKQYAELLRVDNINLSFDHDAIEEMSTIAHSENEAKEDIGARRLHTIIESLLEDISFNATGQHPMIDLKVNRAYVKEHLAKQVKWLDIKKHIL
ncbi:MAG: ATP-dependent protease ATPase subunit HslU [Firmicutes bacterium]|nr:ATP-dependent protease ATPase subunit HslU [Bacillota bacterium]